MRKGRDHGLRSSRPPHKPKHWKQGAEGKDPHLTPYCTRPSSGLNLPSLRTRTNFSFVFLALLCMWSQPVWLVPQ